MTGLPVWEHWDAMVSASRNVLGCDDDALDCAAEAMTQVLERRPTDVANLEAFMVTVAKRRAIDRLRSRQQAVLVLVLPSQGNGRACGSVRLGRLDKPPC